MSILIQWMQYNHFLLNHADNRVVARKKNRIITNDLLISLEKSVSRCMTTVRSDNASKPNEACYSLLMFSLLERYSLNFYLVFRSNTFIIELQSSSPCAVPYHYRGVIIFEFPKEMVEDGHLPNLYQYGSKSYYNLEEMGRKTGNECQNNNDTCVVVVEKSCLKYDGLMNDDTFKPISRKITRSPTATFCPSQASSLSANVAVSLPVVSTLSNENVNRDTTIDSKLVRTPLCSEEVRYSPESNSSSHLDGVFSQNYDKVTKETPTLPTGNGNYSSNGGGALILDNEQSFSARTYSQEIHKTLIAFGVLIFNFFLTTTSLAIIHDRVPKEGPLPDLVLGLVYPREWALQVSEVLIIVTTSIMLIITFLHKYRYIILRRLFLMLSLLYFMRSITMFVTVLPVSSRSYHCSEQKNFTDPREVMKRSLSLFFGMGLTINGRHVYCGDYIYSGHTTILVMSYLMISEYSSKRIIWLHWATWCMSLTGVLMVLLSHSHYTVDVIIGYFVTTRLFWMYHTCANNQLLKKRSAYNYLAREWWFALFQYFESNVRGPLMPLECGR